MGPCRACACQQRLHAIDRNVRGRTNGCRRHGGVLNINAVHGARRGTGDKYPACAVQRQSIGIAEPCGNQSLSTRRQVHFIDFALTRGGALRAKIKLARVDVDGKTRRYPSGKTVRVAIGRALYLQGRHALACQIDDTDSVIVAIRDIKIAAVNSKTRRCSRCHVHLGTGTNGVEITTRGLSSKNNTRTVDRRTCRVIRGIGIGVFEYPIVFFRDIQVAGTRVDRQTQKRPKV